MVTIRVQTEPSQSEPTSPSAYLNSSLSYATPSSSSSFLNLPPTPTPQHSHSHSLLQNEYDQTSTYSHPHYSPYSTNTTSVVIATSYIDQLDAFELAQATYYELLDWMTDLANQAQEVSFSSSNGNGRATRDQDSEEGSYYLLQAEIRRVNAAIVQQAEVVKYLARAIARPSLITSHGSSSSSSMRSSNSSNSSSATRSPSHHLSLSPLAPSP